MWASLIAVLGTLAGAGLSALVQQQQRAADAAQRHHDALLAAVTDLAAALADHRRTMWRRERARLTGGEWGELRGETDRTRGAVTAPAAKVSLLCPAVAGQVRRAERAAYALRGAATLADLSAAREAAEEAADHVLTAAGQTFRRLTSGPDDE